MQEQLKKKEKPLVSIIVPHYQSFDLIQDLLRSIPTDDRLELIVVDDKSGDSKNIKKLAEQIKERGGIFLENTSVKKGAGVCRNIGLNVASGEWILFADADDFFIPGAFDLVFAYTDATEDQVCFRPCSIYQGTKEPGTRHLRYEALVKNYASEPSRLHELKLRYEFYGPVSRMIRAEMLKRENIRFEEIGSSEDVMFSVQAGYYAKSIRAVDSCIYCITCSQNSLSTAHDQKRFLLAARVNARYCRFLQSHLSQSDYNLLAIGGWKYIYIALKEHYGIKTACEVRKIMKEENVLIGFMNACLRKIGLNRKTLQTGETEENT